MHITRPKPIIFKFFIFIIDQIEHVWYFSLQSLNKEVLYPLGYSMEMLVVVLWRPLPQALLTPCLAALGVT